MICNIAYAVPVCLFLSASTAIAEDAVDLAAQMIGRPYVWGAEGPDAFDCSGLMQYVFQEVGVSLPRRAISQSQSGDPARGACDEAICSSSRQTNKRCSSRTSVYTKGDEG